MVTNKSELEEEELIKHYTHEAKRLTHEQLIKWYALTARDMRNFQEKFIHADQEITQLKGDVERLHKALEIVKPALDKSKNEGTGHPWWAIVRKGSFGRYSLLAGPFFSRESANEFQQRQAHNLPKNTLVYCYSGSYCSGRGDWCHFLDAAREALTNLTIKDS